MADKNRNVLLFRGAGREWTEILGIIAELDKPVPSVVVDVLIAEVTLTDKDESGVEFLASAGLGGGQGRLRPEVRRPGPPASRLVRPGRTEVESGSAGAVQVQA